MKKIVFILSSIQHPRSLKRVQEFRSRGYDCAVYGFSRDSGKLPEIEFVNLGSIVNGSSYFKRLGLIFSAIRSVVKQHRGEDSLYYCFGFEIALFVFLFRGRPYIYESSDLMYTYMRSSLVVSFFKFIDRLLIKHSFRTVFTSEGFCQYLFNETPPNVSFITNRLNQSILQMQDADIPVKQFDEKNIVICFTGGLRFKTLLSFAEVVADEFPNISLNFHGTIANLDSEFNERVNKLKNASNIHFFPPFKTPDDLPRIYSSVDLILCTYDTKFANVRLAEPNKLYEAIYFRRPIIVSLNTFLAKKVEKLGIGCAVNADDPSSVREMLAGLSRDRIAAMQSAAAKISKNECVNINTSFFEMLQRSFGD